LNCRHKIVHSVDPSSLIFFVFKSHKKFAELALLDWTSGIRVFYCADAPLEILVDPFRRALARSLNRFCLNATACRLVRPTPFAMDHIVLLDGYPKLNYGAVQFRFVIVLPPDAVPLDRLKQPFLSREILSNFLSTSIKEFERRFGWKVSSYERFPKFDSITEFMNTALLPIGFILIVLMFLLAYWSSTMRSVSDSFTLLGLTAV
uniref:GPI transamidase component PIG-T n=1 Tax=Thelazia callipaeda TaxID=103827 RepID=A0A0N5CN87_THECL